MPRHGREVPKPSTTILDNGEYSARITRKAIRRLYLRVAAESGEIRISAPLHLTDDTIRTFIAEHKGWVDRHRMQLAQLPRCNRIIQDGNDVHILGRSYTIALNFCSKTRRIRESDDGINLFLRSGDGPDAVEAVMNRWIDKQLRIGVQ